MNKKQWFIVKRIDGAHIEIISRPMDSLVQAREVWTQLQGDYTICETVFG